MKIRHSASHFKPHSFLAFELCAHVSTSKYVKQEDEKTLLAKKSKEKIAVLQILFLVLKLFFCYWEICQLLLTYTSY